MRRLRRAALGGAAVAVGVGIIAYVVDASAQQLPANFLIELPPLADAILNGNISDLDPALVEALNGDFSFALGIGIGSAFASENVALAEAFTSAIVLRRGSGSGEARALVQAFASPELTRVRAWINAQVKSPQPVSPD